VRPIIGMISTVNGILVQTFPIQAVRVGETLDVPRSVFPVLTLDCLSRWLFEISCQSHRDD